MVREKMSRFLSFAMHVASAEEAMAKVKEFQNRFHDSRHVCWAYMLGSARATWQLSDNGEPSGTAGKPILGQINSKGLTDVLVVVARYFGGIKLGTSGLIAAYREAAREALENAAVIECHDMSELSLSFSYVDMEGVMRIIKNENLMVVDKVFDNLCSMTLSVRKDDASRLAAAFEKAGAVVGND